MRFRRPLAVAASSLGLMTMLAGLPRTANAQEERPGTVIIRAKSLNNLKEALDVTAWDSERHGPILALAPDKV